MSPNIRTRKNGFVVIVVLCIVMMLAVILFGFNAESRLNFRTVENTMNNQRALNCARAGLNIVIAVVRTAADENTFEPLRKMLLEETTFNLTDGTCSISLVDENAKLNINMLKNKYGKPDRNRIDQLLRLIDNANSDSGQNETLSYDLVPSIIDWVDDDDDVTYLPFIGNKNLGAESYYYNKLRPFYDCKNAPLDTIQELLLVKGMTPQVYSLIGDSITVYGDGKININYASTNIIESLSEKMDNSLAKMIVEQRKNNPFESTGQLRYVPGMTDEIFDEISDNITVRNKYQYYHIRTCGTVDNIDCTIIAVIRKNMNTKAVEVVVYEEC